jgi:hypothetical protein
MGRSYWFECSRCGYRARISGRADSGLQCFIQTIVCRDCKELYDAVTRLKVPDELSGSISGWRLKQGRPLNTGKTNGPPSFQSVLNRLPYSGIKRFKWLKFKLQCPVSAAHRVQSWNDPDKCPRCGIHLEKNTLPYRIWE